MKKDAINITCGVKDPGRPTYSNFKWYRGQHRLPDETASVLEVESANLETKDNFTCLAVNAAGEGDTATVFVDIVGQ